MLNEIDLEFSKKLDKMDLSEPESELGGRRADEQQNMMVSAFLQANRQRRHPPPLRLNGPITPSRSIGGRQSISSRKSSAAKRRPRRKSSATKRRRRRTSRK
jgi:hypothetical protein